MKITIIQSVFFIEHTPRIINSFNKKTLNINSSDPSDLKNNP